MCVSVREREREYNGFRMVISKKSFLLYFLTNERFSDCEYVWMTLLITLRLNITQREREREIKWKRESESLSLWGKIFHKDWDIGFAQAVKGKCHLSLGVSFCTTSSVLQRIMQESGQLTKNAENQFGFFCLQNMLHLKQWHLQSFGSQHYSNVVFKFWCYSKRNCIKLYCYHG